VIPEHLQSTVNLVARAYPNGVPGSEYLPLLNVLADHLCDENLAILALLWTQRPGSRLNDVLLAQSSNPVTDEVVAKLSNAGFSEWTDEAVETEL
jgi:hypothetical protein